MLNWKVTEARLPIKSNYCASLYAREYISEGFTRPTLETKMFQKNIYFCENCTNSTRSFFFSKLNVLFMEWYSLMSKNLPLKLTLYEHCFSFFRALTSVFPMDSYLKLHINHYIFQKNTLHSSSNSLSACFCDWAAKSQDKLWSK